MQEAKKEAGGKIGDKRQNRRQKATLKVEGKIGGRMQDRRMKAKWEAVCLHLENYSIFHPELFCSRISATGQHLEGIFIRPNTHPKYAW